jgi:uncharacterized protein YjdB
MAIHAEVYLKVTDVTSLQDGDQVVLAYEAGTSVSYGFSSSKKYIDVTTASFAADQVTVDNPKPLTIKKSGNYWNLYVGSKPVGHKSGNSDLDVNQGTTTNFAISITNGQAKIVSQTPGKNNNEVFFAYNTSSPRFALYHAGSNMKEITLYRFDAASQPDKEVTSISLSETALTLREGEQTTLTATLLPADAADKTVEWGTTDAAVVTVNNGVVTALAKGTALVWAKATAVGLADTCEVTILGALEQTTVTYNAVKDPACLTEGAKVFFGTIKEGEDYVMGIYNEATSKNNIKGVAASYGEKRHSVTAEKAYAYTVKRDGDYLIFMDTDGKYLRPISDSKLRSSDILDNQTKWIIKEINQDDATVEVENVGFTLRYIYYNHQGTNDLFQIYDNYDENNMAKLILYASTAPEWVDRVREPWIQVSDTLLDWGKQEPDTTYASDESWKDWGDTRKLSISFNDLSEDIRVWVEGDKEFVCYTESISKDGKNPVEISVYWETDEMGVYEGELHITSATEGVKEIVVPLRAEAVALGTGDDTPAKPEFSVSTRLLELQLDTTNNFSDLQMLTFSADGLYKTLYVKWAHTSSVLFEYEYQNRCMEILVDDKYLLLNDKLHFEAGQAYEDVEVYVAVDNLFAVGTHETQLHFYSYMVNSETELGIDERVTIRVKVAGWNTELSTEDVEAGKYMVEKVMKNGQLVIVRGGKMWNAMGQQVK